MSRPRALIGLSKTNLKKGRKTQPNKPKNEDSLARIKNSDGVPQQTVLHTLRPVVLDCPFFDFNFNVSATTTPAVLDVLDGLLSSTGILQQYPQHSEGQYANGVLRLRQRIKLNRVEVRNTFVGAVSNAVLAADLYNSVRSAMVVVGEDYSTAAVPSYLNGVFVGTSTLDIKGVYYDRTVSLPSQAYDATITTPTPQVINWDLSFDPNLVITCFSTTASGSGSAWDTEERDVLIYHVSDSAIAPHPTMSGTVRVFFEFLEARTKRRRY